MRFRLISIILAACVAATAVPQPVGAAEASPGMRIKLACPTGATAAHPCRGVYYYGADGRRHAFPSAKAYATWYADFSGIRTVTAAFLASVPLGSNVTYRPGVRMVKFDTDPTVYAVSLGGTLRAITSEAAAGTIYGSAWATLVDDVPDILFGNYVFGAEIGNASQYDRIAETERASTIDEDLPSTSRTLTVTTASGSFSVNLIKLQRSRYRMVTDTAEGRDCADGCAAKPLADYVAAAGADIGMHGSYFCPADYPACAGEVNTFLWPYFDTDGDVMVNAGSIPVHKGPMLAYGADGIYRYYHRPTEFGSVDAFERREDTQLEAALSNYPALIEGGEVIVESEERLDDDMRTVKGTRGGIGIDDAFVYLVVVRNATVPDLAEILRMLGATEALNLDGGGSAALWYGGSYVVGPGRPLPNAVLFKRK